MSEQNAIITIKKSVNTINRYIEGFSNASAETTIPSILLVDPSNGGEAKLVRLVSTNATIKFTRKLENGINKVDIELTGASPAIPNVLKWEEKELTTLTNASLDANNKAYFVSLNSVNQTQSISVQLDISTIKKGSLVRILLNNSNMVNLLHPTAVPLYLALPTSQVFGMGKFANTGIEFNNFGDGVTLICLDEEMQRFGVLEITGNPVFKSQVTAQELAEMHLHDN